MNALVTLRREPHNVAPSQYEPGLQRAEFAHRPLFERLEDRQFQTMEATYFRRGGLVTADDVTGRLRLRSDQPISVLARWIARRTIVSFEWRSQTLVPLFQFDLQSMSLLAGVAGAIAELTCVFDDWEVALWFVERNVWLHNAAPIDQINEEAAVFQAARADRFIARG